MSCPYCKSTFGVYISDNLVLCKECEAYYKDNFNYHGYPLSDSTEPSYLIELNQMFAQHLLNSLLSYGGERSVLEIGCLHGSFLRYLRNKKAWNIYGCDIHTLVDDFLVFNDMYSITGKFDIIAMVHTIEHFSNMYLDLLSSKVKEHLNPGGIFYSVTNAVFPIETVLYDMKEPTHFAFPSQKSYKKLFPFMHVIEFQNRWDYSSTCIMRKDEI